MCAIAQGIGGLGLIGLGIGLTTGGVGLAVIYSCAAVGVICEVNAAVG